MNGKVRWSAAKDAELQKRYGFGFDRVLAAIDLGGLLEERRHPNTERYPHQWQLMIEIETYVWVVPFVRQERGIFLKTFFPSRKATREYLRGTDDER